MSTRHASGYSIVHRLQRGEAVPSSAEARRIALSLGVLESALHSQIPTDDIIAALQEIEARDHSLPGERAR